MPIKETEFTKPVAVRLTVDLYQLVVAMRKLHGSDADVLRAGILALWREYQQMPNVAPEAPTPADAPMTPEEQ